MIHNSIEPPPMLPYDIQCLFMQSHNAYAIVAFPRLQPSIPGHAAGTTFFFPLLNFFDSKGSSCQQAVED